MPSAVLEKPKKAAKPFRRRSATAPVTPKSPGKSKKTAKTIRFGNVAELLHRLGDIPPERVRMWPTPGTATLKDLIVNNESKPRTSVCELIDGTLVEKPMGFSESEASNFLIGEVHVWNRDINLGFSTGEAGIVQLTPLQGRGPDYAFYLNERFPNRRRPPGAVPLMCPDFVVEILSKSNTRKEMNRKRTEYFAAGTRLLWEVDLKRKTVMVYRDPVHHETLGLADTLSGEDVLPGFRLSVRKWMDAITSE